MKAEALLAVAVTDEALVKHVMPDHIIAKSQVGGETNVSLAISSEVLFK